MSLTRFMWLRLALALAVSSHVCVAALAHEVQPAIADLEVTDGQARLTFELNLESYLSGIDLDGLEDTDEAEQSADYDRLRALPPEELAQELPRLITRWNAAPILRSGETPVTLEVVPGPLEVADTGNLELPRLTRLVLTGQVPGDSVQFYWPRGAGDIVLRQQGVEDPFTGYLAGGEASPVFAVEGGNAKSGWGVFFEYIPVGYDHILPKGLDHILFVLGLFFLSTRWRPLLAQITAFTAAHTVTLALGALDIVRVPASIVEPLIAASIVYVAVENIFARSLHAWRPAVVFGFGLLHGLGFASVLGAFGLPEGAFVPALLGFNVGVELGQLSVIAAMALLLAVSVRLARHARLPAWEAAVEDYEVLFRAVSIPASLVIAGVGAWWVIERTLL